MTRHQTSPENISVHDSPAGKERIARGRRMLLVAMVAACCAASSRDAQAGNPSAEAVWYAPYTPEGNCAPYKRTYGYTRTRWRKWPTMPTVAQEPEAVPAPRPGKAVNEPPADSRGELPEPDTTPLPDLTPGPGPNPDEPEMAPTPPPGAEPAVPPGTGGDKAAPSDDLDALFPDEPPAKKDDATPDDEPAEDSSKKPDGRIA